MLEHFFALTIRLIARKSQFLHANPKLLNPLPPYTEVGTCGAAISLAIALVPQVF